MMTLDEVEKRISDHYRFFAVTAPGVRVQETGELEALWSIADRYYEEERNG